MTNDTRRPTRAWSRTLPPAAPLRRNSVIGMSTDETRWSELCARKALGRFFRAKGLPSCWRRGSEPPDWWAEISGIRFAVEVTRVYGDILPAGDERGRSAAEQWSFFSTLGREINQMVLEIPDAGSHFVHMEAMRISPNERSELKARIRDYVLWHRGKPTAQEVLIVKKERSRVTIEKKSGEGRGVGWSYSERPGPRSGSEIGRELREIVNRAVAAKDKATAAIKEPTLLVIVDTYNWAKDMFWEELDVGIKTFAGIFRALPCGHCHLLTQEDVMDVGKDR